MVVPRKGNNPNTIDSRTAKSVTVQSESRILYRVKQLHAVSTWAILTNVMNLKNEQVANHFYKHLYKHILKHLLETDTYVIFKNGKADSKWETVVAAMREDCLRTCVVSLSSRA